MTEEHTAKTEPELAEGPRRLVGRRGPGRPALILLGLAVLLISVIGAWVFFQGGNDGSNDNRQTVAEFTGDTDQVTDDFTVGEGWQIHWQNDGQHFEFAIRGDFDFGTVINQDAPGSGVTSPVPVGTFHLEVKADGPWTVQVLQP